jgi:hypothetical protein
MDSFERESQTADPDESGSGPLSTETIFATLSNRRRRYVMHCLRQTNDGLTIRDLSEQLAAWEQNCELTEVRPKERKRLYTALHQTHLPKMDAFGIVEYDSARGVVTLTDAISEFDTYLYDGRGDHLQWNVIYLALGSVLTGLVTIAGLGFAPLSTIDGHVYAAAAAVSITATAGYQTIVDRKRRRRPAVAPSGALVPPIETLEPPVSGRKK